MFIKENKFNKFAVMVKETGEIIFETDDFIECIDELEKVTFNYQKDSHDIVDLFELDEILNKNYTLDSLGKYYDISAI